VICDVHLYEALVERPFDKGLGDSGTASDRRPAKSHEVAPSPSSPARTITLDLLPTGK
jgi:hypothetical protein